MNTIDQLGMSPAAPRVLSPRDLCRLRPLEGADVINYFRLVLAFGIFPNIPFLMAPHLLHVSARGLVNVDYLAVGIMACFLGRLPVFAAMVLVTAFDVVERFIFVFYFSQRDLASSLQYLSLVPLAHSLPIAAGLVVTVAALSWSALGIAPPTNVIHRMRGAVCLTITLVLVCLADVVSGTNDVIRVADTRMSVNIASAPAFSVLRAIYNSNMKESARVGMAPDSATNRLLSSLKDPAVRFSSQSHIVLVLVESYGQLMDAASSSALAAPYNRTGVESRYLVESGAIPFRGGTVSAELRELCGLTGDVSTVPVPDNISAGCLPALLEKKGYRSTAIHGYVGEMFERNHWYPRLGFTKSLFLEDLSKHPEIHDCRGFFEGACDADIARFVHSILLAHRDRPQFVYWVTLNSHLPLPPSVGVGQNLDCGANGIADSDVCLWARLIFNVNDAIAEVASDPAIGPTEFLVVGDHGPPFWRTARRSLFSQTHVPYFRLIPRT